MDEFYIWLVKSEDIDTMTALKEAVTDEDYLNDSMKVGNGSCGLKGFKRKACVIYIYNHLVITLQYFFSHVICIHFHKGIRPFCYRT